MGTLFGILVVVVLLAIIFRTGSQRTRQRRTGLKETERRGPRVSRKSSSRSYSRQRSKKPRKARAISPSRKWSPLLERRDVFVLDTETTGFERLMHAISITVGTKRRRTSPCCSDDAVAVKPTERPDGS